MSFRLLVLCYQLRWQFNYQSAFHLQHWIVSLHKDVKHKFSLYTRRKFVTPNVPGSEYTLNVTLKAFYVLHIGLVLILELFSELTLHHK